MNKTQTLLPEEEFSDPIPKVEGVVLRNLGNWSAITLNNDDDVITVNNASITVNDNNATGWEGWTHHNIRKAPVTTQEMLPEEEFSDPIPKVEGVVLRSSDGWPSVVANNDFAPIAASTGFITGTGVGAGASDFYTHLRFSVGHIPEPIPEPEPVPIQNLLNSVIHDRIRSKMGHFIYENTGRRGRYVEDFLVVCRTLFTETLRELAQSGLINIRRSEVTHRRAYYTFNFEYSYNLLNYREPYNGQFRCDVM
jgi:hypothetical protein